MLAGGVVFSPLTVLRLVRGFLPGVLAGGLPVAGWDLGVR